MTVPIPVAWRVRRHDAPAYWIVFLHEPVDALKDPEREVQPLYDPAGLDGTVAAERERCAKLCESTFPEWNPADATFQLPCFDTPAECAAAIRGLR